MTREELENRMAVLLGGRAAEEIAFGRFSTAPPTTCSASPRLPRDRHRYGNGRRDRPCRLRRRASELPRQAVPVGGAKPYSEATAREIDIAVREIVAAIYRRTLELLGARRRLLRESAHCCSSARRSARRSWRGSRGRGAALRPLPRAA